MEAKGQAIENELGGQNATGDTADSEGMHFLDWEWEQEQEIEEEHEAEEQIEIEKKEKPMKDNLAKKLEEMDDAEMDGDWEWQWEIAGEIEDLVTHYEYEYWTETEYIRHDTEIEEPDPMHIHWITLPFNDTINNGTCENKPGHEEAGWGGCPWYVDNGGCGEWEDWLPQDNCCFCGGGIRSDGKTVVESVCEDIPGHEEAGWGGCPWYVENGQCGEWEDWLPAINCCFCGGGQEPEEAK